MSTEQRLAISEEGRRVAWFDLWVTTPFALPFFSEIYVSLVYYVHFQLGFGGTVPGFAPIHWMFINIMGVLAVLWALIRLRLPIREFALADAYARLVVAALGEHRGEPLKTGHGHAGGVRVLTTTDRVEAGIPVRLPNAAVGVQQVGGRVDEKDEHVGHAALHLVEAVSL